MLNVFKNKKVLITGNTGFKGSWLSAWMLMEGAAVSGISNGIPTIPSHFEAGKLSQQVNFINCDIRDAENLKKNILEIQPDFVFHLAAQPLVRLSYYQPRETIETNAQGTANVLDALNLLEYPCTAIMITSDKCYDNQEWTWGYRETDPLGGKDPYSASKGAAELVIKTYAHSFFENLQHPVKISVGRAGNVIGGGDWAADRIVPDCMKAWSENQVVEIRRPDSTRPWQHVLEPLSGYLKLAVELAKDPKLNGEAFNFGPPSDQNFTVQELIEEMQQQWESVRWKDVSIQQNETYEANLLKLCCDKALHRLSWKPVLDFAETVSMTVNWYKNYYEGNSSEILDFSMSQIQEYKKLAKKRGIEWA